jgi:hypothetical protein
MHVPLFTAAEVNRILRAGLAVWCSTPAGERAQVTLAEECTSDQADRTYQGVGPDRPPGRALRVRTRAHRGGWRWCVPLRVWTEP